MDQEIGVLERVPIVGRIHPMCFGMGGVETRAAQNRTELPDIRSNDEIGAHLTADRGWKNARDPTIFQHLAVSIDTPANHAHGATGVDRRGEMAGRQRDSALVRQRGRNRRERNPQIRESLGQMARAEFLECISMQKFWPEHNSRQLGQVLPAHSGRDTRADHATGAGASDKRWPDAGFGQHFIDADVSQASHGAAA